VRNIDAEYRANLNWCYDVNALLLPSEQDVLMAHMQSFCQVSIDRRKSSEYVFAAQISYRESSSSGFSHKYFLLVLNVTNPDGG